MPAKKKKKTSELFTLEEKGPAADGNGKLYCGWVGGHEIGCVISANKSAARKKLIGIARRMLK